VLLPFSHDYLVKMEFLFFWTDFSLRTNGTKSTVVEERKKRTRTESAEGWNYELRPHGPHRPHPYEVTCREDQVPEPRYGKNGGRGAAAYAIR
jgi:hypothetical protein